VSTAKVKISTKFFYFFSQLKFKAYFLQDEKNAPRHKSWSALQTESALNAGRNSINNFQR
jgi:hypothetical protein